MLLGVLTNRTFLAWTSSGLETALFGCLLLAWVYAALFTQGGRGASLVALAHGGAARALAARWALVRGGDGGDSRRALAFRYARGRCATCSPALPLLIPVVHVLWRRATYGYWLPNTYFAKHVAAWPEAGARYFAAFLLEYAYWIALVLALVAGVRLLRGGTFVSRLRAGDAAALTKVLVGGALGLHFAYYTFLVGGDHFEFRVYQHWVPLVLVGFACARRAGGPHAAPHARGARR